MWSTHHKESERLAEEAYDALKRGDKERAKKLFGDAAREEANAFVKVGTKDSRTLGITAVSVASLWLKAGELAIAKRVASMALKVKGMPAFAAEQLDEILKIQSPALKLHLGEDYAVAMFSQETTENASIMFGSKADDAFCKAVVDSYNKHENLKAQLERANRIIGWMMPYIGSMCPPDNGLYELNIHCCENKVPEPGDEAKGRPINQEGLPKGQRRRKA